MTKSDNTVQRVENDRWVDQFIVIQLTQILGLRYPFLIELEIVQLQAKSNWLEHIIHDPNDELLMVSVESTGENGKEMDISVLDFSGFAENPIKDTNDLWRSQSTHLRAELKSIKADTSCSSQCSLRIDFSIFV